MSEPLALVIEDDIDLAFITGQALEEAGFEVETIHCGAEAMERLEEVTPEVVILDLYLPNVSGIEILRHIRADWRMADTRVIVVTVDARMSDEIKHDADLVLIKPISYEHLRDLATRLCQ